MESERRRRSGKASCAGGATVRFVIFFMCYTAELIADNYLCARQLFFKILIILSAAII